MKLGELIKNYREDNSLSIRDFAKRCDISHQYIFELEKDSSKKNPSIMILNKIARNLGMDLVSMLDVVDDIDIDISSMVYGFSNDKYKPLYKLLPQDVLIKRWTGININTVEMNDFERQAMAILSETIRELKLSLHDDANLMYYLKNIATVYPVLVDVLERQNNFYKK